jgi:alcohol dehydrogenase class IV
LPISGDQGKRPFACHQMIQTMPTFEFSTASRILFGSGTIEKAATIIAELGKTCFLVTGGNPSRAKRLTDDLEREKIEYEIFSVAGEPSIDRIEEGVSLVRRFKDAVVVGFGGGSVIDSAKAIGGLVPNEGNLIDYLEVIGGGKPLPAPGLPCIAIPTTAGTGAEVTKNCVLLSPQHRQKVSLRSRYLLPSVAIIDPDLTLPLPPDLTASTGLDAFTQVIEPFVSRRANPLTDALCRDALPRAARSLERCFNQGDDRAAREEMALCSLFGGLALANAGLGAVHGFAGSIGGMFAAPHGAVCAALLPSVISKNIEVLKSRASNHPALPRFDEIATLITGNRSAKAVDAARWTADLCQRLGVKPLGAYGMKASDVATVARMSLNASSMKGNPVDLSLEDLIDVLHRAL